MSDAPGSMFSVLRRHTSFRLLFVATAASSLGSLLAIVALTLHVKEQTDSGAWVGALLIVEFLPTIVIGLTLGPLVDRLSRRGLMIASDLVRCAVFCALAFLDSAAAIVALAAVAGVATGFFRPAVYAGLPNLVAEDDLPAANSLLQTVENAAWALGPVLGGTIVAVSGADAAYWVNAATFLVSAVLVAGIPHKLLQTARALGKGHWRDIVDGVALVRGSRALATVLVVWSVVMVGSAAVNVSEVFLAQDTFDAGSFGFGLLYGSIGVGLALGSLLAGGQLERHPVGLVYAGSIALMALGFAGAALSPNIWIAASFAGAGGVGNGVAGVCNALLVQRGAPDDLRGRAFTLIMSANYAVLGLAMAAAGPLTDAVGPRAVWGFAAGVLAAAAAAALVLTRGLEEPAPERRPVPEEAGAY